jgi:hypothetical protein
MAAGEDSADGESDADWEADAVAPLSHERSTVS